MATKKSSSTSTGKKSSSSPDAIALLRADHEAVKKLFKQFEKTEEDDEKIELAASICKELTVHATIEEEIFYPAARAALVEDGDLLDEAEVEHASAKELIAQIESGSPDDERWEAKVTVLGEYIDHHVQEEQDEMFKKVRETDVDLGALGEQMLARKSELMDLLDQEMSIPANRKRGASKGARPNA